MSILLGGSVLQIAECIRDHTQTVRTYQIGEPVSGAGIPLFVSDSGKLMIARANSKSTMLCRYLSLAAGAINSFIPVLEYGVYTNSSFAFIPGNTINDAAGLIYINDVVAGSLTQMRPSAASSIVQIVGHAISAQQILFNPDSSYVVRTA